MRQRDLIVNPTLACGNPLNFKEDLDILEKTGIKILHIDIMDGHYVPNLCFDTGMVGLIRKNYSFLLDVHLMVTNPEDYIQPLAAAGCDPFSDPYVKPDQGKRHEGRRGAESGTVSRSACRDASLPGFYTGDGGGAWIFRSEVPGRNRGQGGKTG